MLFSKFDITRRGTSTIGEFKRRGRRGRRGKKYCSYARSLQGMDAVLHQTPDECVCAKCS